MHDLNGREGSQRRDRHVRHRRGFIFIYGWRTITTREFRRAVHGPCPKCNEPNARLVGYVRRRWFTLMFIPIVPIEPATHGHRTTRCRACGARFDVPLEDLGRSAPARQRNTLADTFPLYNDLRDHPTDGQRLLKLLEMYEAADEPGEAESAVRHFPEAMKAEPRCAEVLERLRQPQSA